MPQFSHAPAARHRVLRPVFGEADDDGVFAVAVGWHLLVEQAGRVRRDYVGFLDSARCADRPVANLRARVVVDLRFVVGFGVGGHLGVKDENVVSFGVRADRAVCVAGDVRVRGCGIEPARDRRGQRGDEPFVGFTGPGEERLPRYAGLRNRSQNGSTAGCRRGSQIAQVDVGRRCDPERRYSGANAVTPLASESALHAVASSPRWVPSSRFSVGEGQRHARVGFNPLSGGSSAG